MKKNLHSRAIMESKENTPGEKEERLKTLSNFHYH